MRWWSALAVLLVGACLQFLAQGVSAEESLASLVEAFEKTEKEMADLQGRLKTASEAAERHRLQVRIKELEEEQARLLPELEKSAGPLPPAIRPQAPNRVVEKLEHQRLRNEALQDRQAEEGRSGQ